jgi:hypothetical protein
MPAHLRSALEQTAVQDELSILVERFQPVLRNIHHVIKIPSLPELHNAGFTPPAVDFAYPPGGREDYLSKAGPSLQSSETEDSKDRRAIRRSGLQSRSPSTSILPRMQWRSKVPEIRRGSPAGHGRINLETQSKALELTITVSKRGIRTGSAFGSPTPLTLSVVNLRFFGNLRNFARFRLIN